MSRGGKREGSGRPKGDRKVVSIYIKDELWEAIAHENKSLLIERLLNEYLAGFDRDSK